MSFLKIKSHGQSVTEVDEFLISSSDDTANLPDDAAPGSMAYTADLTYLAIKDIDGSWVAAIGGGDNAADNTEETPADNTEETPADNEGE